MCDRGRAASSLVDEGIDEVFGTGEVPFFAAVATPGGTYRRAVSGVRVSRRWVGIDVVIVRNGGTVIERCYRDTLGSAQHLVASTAAYERLGSMLLTLKSDSEPLDPKKE